VTDASENVPESDPEQEQANDTEISPPLSERTAARAAALNTLDQLRLGPNTWGQVVREISSRVRPHVDSEALPQWVVELEIEAWVPAEDVRNIYQHVQRRLLREDDHTKTRQRTFKVAQFVWEEELRSGDNRPSWRILWERWRKRNPEAEVFKDWRAFRACCEKGKEATPPRYEESNDYIANEAREHTAGEARRQRLRYLPE
jgi:hypothetical protein